MSLFGKKNNTAEAQTKDDQQAENKQAELRQDSEELIKEVKKYEKSVKNYQHLMLRLVLFVLVLWVLFFKIIGITIMPSGDMYPRLDAGDMVLFYRLDTDVKARDVIVVEKQTPDSGKNKQVFILRVVAVGGDTVEITDNAKLLINGNAVSETNIFYSTPRYEGFTEFPVTLADDECFVLADSRNGGSDSRYFGPVKKSEIVGSVITILRRNNL